VTDKLRSYGVAHRELMPDVFHDNSQYANNRAEQSHEATRIVEELLDVGAEFPEQEQADALLAALKE
jgi:putative transposase